MAIWFVSNAKAHCCLFFVEIQLIFINSTRLTTQLIETFTVSNSFYFYFPPNHIILDMVFNPRCYPITMNHNLSFALIFNRFVSLDDFLSCFFVVFVIFNLPSWWIQNKDNNICAGVCRYFLHLSVSLLNVWLFILMINFMCSNVLIQLKVACILANKWSYQHFVFVQFILPIESHKNFELIEFTFSFNM